MTAATLVRRDQTPTASATALVRSARTPLVIAVIVRGLLAGLTAVAVALLGVALADIVHPLSLTTRLATRVIAIAAGVSVMGALLWRDRHVLSLTHVALWLEERVPALDY